MSFVSEVLQLQSVCIDKSHGAEGVGTQGFLGLSNRMFEIQLWLNSITSALLSKH